MPWRPHRWSHPCRARTRLEQPRHPGPALRPQARHPRSGSPSRHRVTHRTARTPRPSEHSGAGQEAHFGNKQTRDCGRITKGPGPEKALAGCRPWQRRASGGKQHCRHRRERAC
eukprot:4574877-Alexandrium_andersonii.AAC.1